jgi:hypothetical protein
MANKYFFDVPYSCITYGRLKGYVIADDIEDAVDKINSRDFEDEEYEDRENGSYDYDCSEDNVTLDEYNDNNDDEEFEENRSGVPVYYLAEVLLI